MVRAKRGTSREKNPEERWCATKISTTILETYTRPLSPAMLRTVGEHKFGVCARASAPASSRASPQRKHPTLGQRVLSLSVSASPAARTSAPQRTIPSRGRARLWAVRWCCPRCRPPVATGSSRIASPHRDSAVVACLSAGAEGVRWWASVGSQVSGRAGGLAWVPD